MVANQTAFARETPLCDALLDASPGGRGSVFCEVRAQMSWWFALLPPWQRGVWVGLQGHQSCGGDTATRVGLLLQGHAEEMDDQLIRGSVDQVIS